MRFLTRYDLHTEIRKRDRASIYSAVDTLTDLALYVALLDKEGSAPQDKAELLIDNLRNELPVAQYADPHLLAVLDYDLEAQQGHPLYIISEALVGRSLPDPLRAERGLAPSDALGCCYEAARCVESLHGRGIVHGAISIDHFVARENGSLVLLTPALSELFGIDLFTGGTSLPSATQDYSAPETRIQGAGGVPTVPTVAVDIYSLGMLLFHLLVGYARGDGSQVMGVGVIPSPIKSGARAGGPYMPLLTERIGDAVLRSRLRKFIQVATARDPLQRWPDIGTFIEALEQIAPGEPIGEALVAPFKKQTVRAGLTHSVPRPEATQPHTASLAVSASGATYEVRAPRTTVGVVRASGFVPDISLNNESSELAQYVSQHHLDLIYTGGRWYVRPYEGARNPTFLDDRELPKGGLYSLHDGSQLAVPALRLIFHLAEVPAQVTQDKE